ncbi:MAG: hypothetical protein J0M33_02675 [Anaerolineae bacterium]|nr:hypothetical protein [Anaerolineae bacterium]
MFTQLNMLLNSAIRADPLLCLANAICWLDPLWRSDSDEVEGDTLATGLLVAREAFPDAYAGAIERIRAGMPDREIDGYLCAEISKAGIPVDDLESLGYGIPLPAYGVRLEDPDFHESHPDVLPILALFGAEEDANEFDLSEQVYKVGRLLHERLIAQDDPAWKQVGWALGWLYSCSSNSAVDLDWEDMSEFQPLSWEADNVAFAKEIIEEAEVIMSDVAAGLTLLAGPNVQVTLRRNIERVYRHLKEGKSHDRHLPLDWNAALVGADGAAEPHAGVLLVRRDVA